MTRYLILFTLLFFISCENSVAVLSVADLDKETEISDEAETVDEVEEIEEEQDISDEDTALDDETCEAVAVPEVFDSVCYTCGPETFTLTGDCGAQAMITCEVDFVEDQYNICTALCSVESVNWGDDGKGNNVYSIVQLESDAIDSFEVAGIWTKDNEEDTFKTFNKPCENGHARYSATIKLKMLK